MRRLGAAAARREERARAEGIEGVGADVAAELPLCMMSLALISLNPLSLACSHTLARHWLTCISPPAPPAGAAAAAAAGPWLLLLAARARTDKAIVGQRALAVAPRRLLVDVGERDLLPRGDGA